MRSGQKPRWNSASPLRAPIAPPVPTTTPTPTPRVGAVRIAPIESFTTVGESIPSRRPSSDRSSSKSSGQSAPASEKTA